MDENDLTGEAAAQRVLESLAAAGETLAVAESLTGGLLAATVVSVPGASRAFRGGVVAYADELKERLLAVDPAVLERSGAIDETVAVQMAQGARWRLDSTWALSTTGVAGPDPQPSDPSGAEVGTVFVGIAGPRVGRAVRLQLDGDRTAIRSEAVRRALLLLARELSPGGQAGTADRGDDGATADTPTPSGDEAPSYATVQPAGDGAG